ncbi:MAG: vancomycin high temperature exclusion protein [Spirochaetaceae bacterium]
MAAIVSVGIIVFANASVSRFAQGSLYSDAKEIPYNQVGLLLGTSRYLGSGRPNPYFDNRIDAAGDLYAAGKIKIIVASGDNAHHSYNEPVLMKQELLRRGVPEGAILLDYAGFSTLDSVIRVHRIFGQERFTVISQEFHNERALYIARHHSLEAVGYNARPISGPLGIRTSVREYLARVKAVLDVHVLGSEPRFLGDPIPIPSES